MSTSSNTASPAQKHRREVWLQIVAPVILSAIAMIVLCVVLIFGVATGALVGKQITSMMGILFSAFIAIPLCLICLVPCFLLMALAYGAGRLYRYTMTPVRFARRVTDQLAEQTKRHVPRLGQPLISLNVRLTRWEHRLLGSRSPMLPSGKEETDE